MGYGALEFVTTGFGNTAVGRGALGQTTGQRNTALGYSAGLLTTTGTDNIHIRNVGVAAETKTIKIGTEGTQERAFIAGIRGVTTGAADAVTVMIDSNGQLGTVSSSRRYKEDISDMAAVSERLLALRPVTFRYNKALDDGEKPIQFGLIAEEVAEVFPELVVYDRENRPETVKYHLLSSLLLNELQKVEAWQTGNRSELEALRERVAELEALVGRSEAVAIREQHSRARSSPPVGPR